MESSKSDQGLTITSNARRETIAVAATTLAYTGNLVRRRWLSLSRMPGQRSRVASTRSMCSVSASLNQSFLDAGFISISHLHSSLTAVARRSKRLRPVRVPSHAFRYPAVTEQNFKPSQSGVQAGLHGTSSAAERDGHLGLAEPVVIPQHDGRPLLGAEGLNCGPHCFSNLRFLRDEVGQRVG